MGTIYGPNLVTDGLVLCLDAGNTLSYPGSGATWSDLSGNGNDVTLSGLTYDSGGWFQSTSGTSGSATTSTTLLPVISYGITMDCWYRSASGDSFSTYGRLMDRGDTSITLGTHLSYRIRNWVYAGGSRGGELVKDGIGTDDKWHNMVLSYNGSNAYFYLDGSSESYVAKTGSLESTTLTIFNGDSYGFGGKISIVKIYDRALTAAKILQNYNAHKGRYGL